MDVLKETKVVQLSEVDKETGSGFRSRCNGKSGNIPN